MSLRINLNAAAQSATRYLTGNDNALGKSIEKLSSGYKINRAGDDPAGLVISEKLRAQIAGLGQAIQNSNDAINMIQTAEGALNEVHSLLRSMRSLAVHASNTGANDSAAIAADQSQIDSAIAQLNRISTNTQFGQKKLLDGSAGTQASIINTTKIGNASMAASTVAGYVSVQVTAVATKASVDGSNTYATVGTAVDNAGTITLNGSTITVDAADTVQVVINKINALTNTTGVAASWDTDHVQLDQTGYGTNSAISYAESADVLNGGLSAAAFGIDATATVTTLGTGGGPETYNAGKGLQLKGATSGSVINLTTSGNALATYASSLYVTQGTLDFQVGAFAGQTTSLSLQSSASNQLGLSATGLTNSGWTVADMDVSTFAGAQDAIKLIDAAITEISTMRSDLGAFQKNVLESNVNSLAVAKENIAASESSIRDTDMAAEMVTFTRNQILEQAGVSMLAQANMAPQALLKLLG